MKDAYSRDFEENLRRKLKSQKWRLSNLYWIIDKEGREVRFKMNWAQRALYAGLWYYSLALKARQLGVTTLICIYILDTCLFHSNTSAGIIAHNREDAEDFFRNKVKFAYDHLPELLKRMIPATTDSARMLSFANGSSIKVGTSMRSGTLNLLHVCLAAGTGIIGKDGIVTPIESVKPGDLVLTDRGSYQTVNALIKNRLADIGKKLLSVTTFGYYEPLLITENHSVMTREKRTGYPVWKQASELKPGEYIAFPIREPSLKSRDGLIPFGTSSYTYDASGKRVRNTGKRVQPTFNVGWLCGFYLAEGSIRSRTVGARQYQPSDVTYSIHRDETNNLLEKLEAIRPFLGNPRTGADLIRIYDSRNSLTRTITLNSKDFAAFLSKNFGASDNKHIPDTVWNWGSEFLKGLLKGYFDGDGSYTSRNHISVTSTRRQLIDQIRLLLISLRFGYPTIYHSESGVKYGRACKEAWVLKLHGAGNWKFREAMQLPMPDVPNTWRSRWRVDHGRRPEGSKFWRRGRDHYWARITNISEARAEQYVYDISLDGEPHNYTTVNGVVHNSEFGKICAKYPDKAKEIVTGALNTVQAGQFITIESTAEGQHGYFYEYCKKAQDMEREGRKLTPLDFKFFFFPWYEHPDYQLDPEGVIITSENELYFQELSDKHGIHLTPAQKAWYVKKAETQGDDMKREYPSTPEEAFEASIIGAYYAQQMTKIRKEQRIRCVPYEPTIPVNTGWDLGRDDANAIWFHQRVGMENRIIDYYENQGEVMAHYAKVLHDKGYIYGEHFLPHDIEVTEYGGNGKSRKANLENLGIKNITTIERELDLEDMEGVEAVRNFLVTCWFDEVCCAQGIKCLDNFQKQWDEKIGGFKARPMKNFAIHGADAFKSLALGYSPKRVYGKRKQRRRDGRVV